MKIIIHVDFDCYFVSAERTLHHNLKDKPVVVTGGGERGILMAVSYEARTLGARTAMPVFKAKKLSNELIFIKPTFKLYPRLSNEVFSYIMSNYSNDIEVGSIDEAYFDFSKIANTLEEASDICFKLQREIKQKFDLPLSFGISQNKFVAKMATSLKKPFGVSVLDKKDYQKVYGNEKVIKVYGIGSATSKKMNSHGIFKIKDMLKLTKEEFLNNYNKPGIKMFHNSRGEDFSEFGNPEIGLKSISNSITFRTGEIKDHQILLNKLHEMVSRSVIKMNSRNLIGSIISVGIKDSTPGKTKPVTRQKNIQKYTNNLEELKNISSQLFDELWTGSSLKFISFSITDLKNMYEEMIQTNIFNLEENSDKVIDMVRNINYKFRDKVVFSGKEYATTKDNPKTGLRLIDKDWDYK